MGKCGAQTQLHSIIPAHTGTRRGWTCPKCGRNVAHYASVIKRHKEKHCLGKRVVRSVHEKRSRGKLYVFYRGGRIHCLVAYAIAKLIHKDGSTTAARLRGRWSIEQIIGEEPPPAAKHGGGNLTGNNKAGGRKLTSTEKRSQSILSKAFKSRT